MQTTIEVRISLVCLLSFGFVSSTLAADDSTLESHLSLLVKNYKGKVAIGIKNLATDEALFLNADEPMPTASLIKLPVLLELYQQACDGKIGLGEMMVLQDQAKVPGSGILTEHFSAGTALSVRDAARLMIAFSDNTATNLVLDKIGIKAVNKRMDQWGCPNTKIHHKVYCGDTTSVAPERSKKFGLGSTTAREMIALLEDLEVGDRFRPAIKQVILGHLKTCEDKEKFSRFLPEETMLAHKTGTINAVRTDAGILYLPSGPVALCVLTADNEDQSWKLDNAGNLLCAKVAKEGYDHFNRNP